MTDSNEKTQGKREKELRSIVADKQCTEIDGVLVDSTTANMLVKVIDALNESNKRKFLKLPITRMATIGWSLFS